MDKDLRDDIKDTEDMNSDAVSGLEGETAELVAADEAGAERIPNYKKLDWDHSKDAVSDNGYGKKYKKNYQESLKEDRGGKKEHPVLKSLGLLAAKTAIISVIASLAVGTTAVVVSNATGLTAKWNAEAKAASESSSGSSSDSGNSSGLPFDIPGYGSGGSGSSGSGAAEENNGPKLGVTVKTVDDEMKAEGYPAGVLIVEVTKGSDAEAAGLVAGDVITSFDGTVVTSTQALASLVAKQKYGDTVKIVYKRLEGGNYKAYSTEATFTKAWDSAEQGNGESSAESAPAAPEGGEIPGGEAPSGEVPGGEAPSGEAPGSEASGN